MTKDEMQIAIAQACGFTDVRVANPPSTLITGKPVNQAHPNHRVLIPDYPNDLNAMHEVEQSLVIPDSEAEQMELNRYAGWILQICKTAGTHYTFMANASQRAEAFLRSKGLWV